MNKAWWIKNWWIVILVALGITAIAIGIFKYFSKPENKIKFGLGTQDDLSNLLPNLNTRMASPNQKGFGFYLDVPLTLFAKNKSAKAVTMNNVSGTVSYEGEPIFQTKADSAKLENVRVAGKSREPITDTFQVLINGKTVKFIKDYLAGKKPRINYNLNALIAGESYHFKDSVIMNEGTGAPEVTDESTGGEETTDGENNTNNATGGRG